VSGTVGEDAEVEASSASVVTGTAGAGAEVDEGD
jgi:hypothetical protein